MESYRRAIEIGERLVRENPTIPAHRGTLAASHYAIGNLQSTRAIPPRPWSRTGGRLRSANG